MAALGLGRVKTRGETQDLATNGAPILPVRLCPDRCNERLDAHDVHHVRISLMVSGDFTRW